MKEFLKSKATVFAFHRIKKETKVCVKVLGEGRDGWPEGIIRMYGDQGFGVCTTEDAAGVMRLIIGMRNNDWLPTYAASRVDQAVTTIKKFMVTTRPDNCTIKDIMLDEAFIIGGLAKSVFDAKILAEIKPRSPPSQDQAASATATEEKKPENIKPTPESHSVIIMTSDEEDLEEPSISVMGSCSLLAVTQKAKRHKSSDQGEVSEKSAIRSRRGKHMIKAKKMTRRKPRHDEEAKDTQEDSGDLQDEQEDQSDGNGDRQEENQASQEGKDEWPDENHEVQEGQEEWPQEDPGAQEGQEEWPQEDPGAQDGHQDRENWSVLRDEGRNQGGAGDENEQQEEEHAQGDNWGQ